MSDYDTVGLPRRNTPCARCDWRYEGFHICFDKRNGFEEKVVDKPKKTKRASSGLATPDRMAQLAEASDAYWARYREKMRPRDEKIIGSYKAGAGLRDISSEFKIGYQTVGDIIRREEAQTGESIMRRVGVTKKHRKEVNDDVAS